MEKKNLLDVKHLSIGFQSYNAQLEKITVQAIKDMSVQLNTGEILAIVGSSGSGKSLLAHAIMDILPDNAKIGGEIYYKGKLLDKTIIDQLRGKSLCFIPQSISYLDPLMQVGEQVRGVRGEAARALQEKAFKHYNLKTGADKLYPFQLSGGMARRVLLSTTFVSDAELIIADEPTPGLDLEIAVEALKDFRALANQGKGVILITHDIDLALHVADKIAIFHDGRVIETADTSCFSGTGEGLKHPYSRALFKALPQNGFVLQKCPKCGASSATWGIDAEEMRCTCGNS